MAPMSECRSDSGANAQLEINGLLLPLAIHIQYVMITLALLWARTFTPYLGKGANEVNEA